ncbi:TonB-dependent receptor [Massilia forsythiae]|uniref:TonB-dependent receptor n=1 Tax=Massilia forsythiae TaxID=2728020 RepID=A0A7Z2ZR43_9BURK|nr:TonB-dependent receptor [Massilia forsythiae]QJD99082.1 TonB-dependent receptor [Massilia forsythiae]
MFTEKTIAKALRLVFSGGAIAAGFGLTGQAALAQDAAQAPMARVEITGSAIKRIDAETAVPVTIIKADDLRKEGITTIEQVMSNLSVSQAQTGTSQSVGASTGGASYADLRGIGANKTLVLLNGRRLANNAYDSSAPDLNMIPFAALERVEVLRDGASALYGSDAVGGVINFITKKDFQGGAATFGEDSPQHAGGKSVNANVAFGFGDLDKDRYNFSIVVDHQEQKAVTGTERPFNTRYAGGLSTSTYPANYYQGGDSYNPAAASGCTTGDKLISDGGTGCRMTTSSYVDYIPRNVRDSGLLRGTFKLSEDHELGVEYLTSQSKVGATIAPVPYGGLYMNRTLANGSLNPFYPTNAALSPTYTEANTPAGVLPGFIHVKWRDLPNGVRQDQNTNRQQRFVTSLQGTVAGWDYNTALTWNENKVRENLVGYSDGNLITAGVLNGIINPFGAQTAAGTALLNSAALSGTVQSAKGTTTGLDFHASRELGDWLHAGRGAGLALGAQTNYEKFESASNTEFAEKVVASTGIDPTARNAGSRHTYALYGELNVPILKTLDVTGSIRTDKYSDFGNSTNPKVSFRFQPSSAVLVRGSYSTGFRAPSLYEINASQSYTNSAGTYDDPVNCPGGVVAAGKSRAANCSQQFQVLNGGNTNLSPEKSKNATLGVVLEPINNLSVGVDLWAIQLRNTIGVLSADDIFADPVKYADVYHRTASGDLSVDGSQCPNPATCGYVDLRTQNLGGVRTNGVDLTGNYRLRTAGYGNFTLGLNATYVHKYEYQNSEGGEWHQNVGVYSGAGPIFRWQNTANLTWARGEFSAGLTGHYKSGYVDQDPSYHVASYSTFDTYVAWTQKKGIGITAGVRNLADRTPPLSYQDAAFQAGYDPRYYDPLGRTYYVRASYSF